MARHGRRVRDPVIPALDEATTIVLGMTGIYNGMTADALVLPNALRADLWVVQRGTRGPFAELSRVSPALEVRARSVPGVRSARAYADAAGAAGGAASCGWPWSASPGPTTAATRSRWPRAAPCGSHTWR